MKHDSHVMHEHSLEGHKENLNGAAYSKRELLIVNWLRVHREQAWTDRHIMTGLGFTDMNAVRPRITELIQRGCLRECGSVVDSVTGKKCRLVGLPQQQLDLELQ